MDFAKLGKDDRNALILAAVVVVTSLTSIIDEWGPGIILALLAAIGVIFVVLQPQVAPTMKLPATKEMTLLVLSAIAALGFVLGALLYLSYIFRVDRIYSIFFDIGLVASIVLTYFSYMRYQAAGGKLAMPGAAPAAPTPDAPAAPAEPMAPAESASGDDENPPSMG